jgi:molybdate transport system substrate-binding protein
VRISLPTGLRAVLIFICALCSSCATPTNQKSEPLTVFAASSLAPVGDQLATDVEKDFGIKVAFQFSGSGQLATQIVNGASPDVFISADRPNLERVAAADLLEGLPVAFAQTELALLVSQKSRETVATLQDLDRPGVLVALGAPGVPVGDYSRAALTDAGVTLTPTTLENNVRAIVTKVELGEVDAGIVYATDVNDETKSKKIRLRTNVSPTLFAGSLTTSDTARVFVEYLSTPSAQAILRANGYTVPVKLGKSGKQ